MEHLVPELNREAARLAREAADAAAAGAAALGRRRHRADEPHRLDQPRT
jgi:methionine synthase I (cobalamin-dependent)